MDTTILQVPISKTLRLEASRAAELQGFSSLQEAVRVFLKKLASLDIAVNFFSYESKDTVLSKKNDRRYDRMIKEIDAGKVIPKRFTSKHTIQDIMAYLNE